MNEETIFDIIERTGGWPVHCAHRGGGYLFGPENTIHTYLKSVNEHKVRLLEIDLRLTKDMQLVIMHDSTVDRTTNGTGLVSDFTLEEILQLDAAPHFPELREKNIRVPTFAEFLDIFIPYADLLFMFDFKDELSVQKTMEVVNQRNIGNRFILGSVFAAPNNLLFETRPSPHVPVITDITQTIAIVTAYSTGLLGWYTFSHKIFGFILSDATNMFWSKGLIDAMHSRGLKVLVCGPELNKLERLKESIEIGVDFIMTDHPHVFSPYLEGL